MKQTGGVLTFIISLIALGISIYSLTLDRFGNSDLIISILIFLITILIAWQIYNTIDINKKVNDIDLMARRYTRKASDKYNYTLKSSMLYIEAMSYESRNITEIAIDKYIAAIYEGMKGEYEFPVEQSISHLYAMSKSEFQWRIFLDKRSLYVKILLRLDDERINSIINKLDTAYE